MRLLTFLDFATICGPVMVLTRVAEMRSYNQIESRTSATGNRLQAENREGDVECVGPEQTGIFPSSFGNVTLRYCSNKNSPDSTRSGNYIYVFFGVGKIGKNSLSIVDNYVETSICKRDQQWSEDCSCKGLLGHLLKEYKNTTESIDLLFSGHRADREKACRCYLGRAKEDAGINFVQLPDCKAYESPQPIDTDYEKTCDDIINKCSRSADQWVLTKTVSSQLDNDTVLPSLS